MKNQTLSNFIIVMSVIISIGFLVVMNSCKTKRIYLETHSTDTIYEKEFVMVTPSSLNELVIEDVCDSLGNLKPFNFKVNNGKNKLEIRTINNTVYIEQNLDSIKQSAIEKYKSSNKTSDKVLEVFKTPKWAWYSLLINIILFLYLFRKSIPYLRLLPF